MCNNINLGLSYLLGSLSYKNSSCRSHVKQCSMEKTLEEAVLRLSSLEMLCEEEYTF